MTSARILILFTIVASLAISETVGTPLSAHPEFIQRVGRDTAEVEKTPAQDRAKKVKPIKPFQWGYMKYVYNPFWYGGPLDGGDTFDGPYGGFAPNPFARPTAPTTPAPK